MARINMAETVDALDENFQRVLAAVFAEVAPDCDLDPRQIMRVFRMRLERGFGTWEQVPGRRC